MKWTIPCALAVVSILGLFISDSFGSSSLDLYFKGDPLSAWQELSRELDSAQGSTQYSALILEQKIRVARAVFSQTQEIPLEKYLSLLTGINERQKNADKVRPDLKTMLEAARMLPALSSSSDAELARSLENNIVSPSLDPDFSRVARLQVLSIVLARRWISDSSDAEVLFLLGKTKHTEASSGEFYLKKYLELPAEKNRSHKEEAEALLKAEKTHISETNF